MEALVNAVSEFISNNSTLVLVGAVTVIEIVPIKINPWSALFEWIKNQIFGDIKKELLDLKTSTIRWNILSFARSCRHNEDHSEEEWNYIISQLKTYETLCEEEHIENGVIEETAVFLRELYHKRLHKNDFS